MRYRKSIWMCLAVLFFFSAVSAAHAGLYWESLMVRKGVPEGMPPNMPKAALEQFNKTEVVKNFFTEDAMRTETADSVMIMNFEAMTMYNLNPVEKTYTVTDLKARPHGQEMDGMMKGMTDGMKVTATDETREIAGFMCRKYKVKMPMGEGIYWVTRDVKEYKTLRKMGKKMEEMMDKSPVLRQMNMAALMDQLDGFPVRTEMDFMGMTTETTLRQIEEKPLKPALFEVPAGYKKVVMAGSM